MNLFSRRPLALFCALFALSSVINCMLLTGNLQLILPVSGLFLVLFLLLIGIIFSYRKRKAKPLSALLALAFIVTALIGSTLTIGKAVSEVKRYGGSEVDCSFIIEHAAGNGSYKSSYQVKDLRIGDQTLHSRAILTLEEPTDFEYGDVVSATVKLHPIDIYGENTSYYRSNGVFLRLEPTGEFFIIGNIPPSRLGQLPSVINIMLCDLVENYIPGEPGHLVTSLLLGNRSGLSEEAVRDFRRTGTTHLLAISGMHLTVLIALFDLLLRAVDLKKLSRTISVLLFAALYVLLTGLTMSAVRAFIMCCFLYFSSLLRGNNDTLTSLFCSLFFMLLVDPYAVYDIGMWMSCAAVLGILVTNLLIPRVNEFLRQKCGSRLVARLAISFVDAVAISFAAGLFVSLPMWLCFDEISLVSIPAGLLLSPLVTWILILAPLLFPLTLFPPLATLLGQILYLLGHVILEGVSYISHIPHISVSLGYRFLDYLMPVASLFIALLLIVKLRRRRWVALGAFCCFLCFLLCLGQVYIADRERISVQYMSENSNEFLFFRTSGLAVACDMGTGSRSMSRCTEEMAIKAYATEIDAYLLTHYHSGHVLGVDRLISTSMIRSLYLPLPLDNDEKSICHSLISLARRENIPIVLYDRGENINIGLLQLNISLPHYLSRSVKPIFSLTAKLSGHTLLYVSSSAHEDATLYGDICEKMPTVDTLILGSHGPNPQTEFSYPLYSIPRVLIPSEKIFPYLVLDKIPSGQMLTELSYLSITAGMDKKEP